MYGLVDAQAGKYLERVQYNILNKNGKPLFIILNFACGLVDTTMSGKMNVF